MIIRTLIVRGPKSAVEKHQGQNYIQPRGERKGLDSVVIKELPSEYYVVLEQKEKEKEVKMSKIRNYVTFGQDHVHSVNGKTFDKDCVATYESPDPDIGRQMAFDYFNAKFCFHYVNKPPDMSWYPRGLIELFPIVKELKNE